VNITTLGGVPIFEIQKTKLQGWGHIYKRAFDILMSLFFIIITSPIMIATAIAIKLDSRGPVFFSYERIGRYGKPFRYFKFRSMVKDAHTLRFDPEFVKQVDDQRKGTPLMKFAEDPRITRVGKSIRKYSIDEFPEFFLVLSGKMSLVGPRPHEPEEVSRYKKHHKRVLDIKPGITGLAQISGRSDLNFEEEVTLDTTYIENWSLWTDIQVVAKTPISILFSKRKSL
jgi:exopolysaccharide biosynthesis polyprenyl glycosylphosphotransferase